MASSVRSITNPVILIVDDECDVRDSLKALLEEEGYSPVCANNGAEALAYLRRSPPPAAILLDLFMPVMSGWDFVRRLRSNSALASIPVVVITASEPHWGYPVPRVLKKPLDPETVLREVREVVHPASRSPAT